MASPTTQTANAIAAITNRAHIPIPEIDFTQHQLENGEVVSTTERVVKDVSQSRRFSRAFLVRLSSTKGHSCWRGQGVAKLPWQSRA